MASILNHMQRVQDKACVLTGDLNLEEQEYHASEWKDLFDKGKIEGAGSTWGGDRFCSTLLGKPTSSPFNLDYTLVIKNTCATITTSYVETGFDGAAFNPGAISDHKGLLSIITFGTSHGTLQSDENEKSHWHKQIGPQKGSSIPRSGSLQRNIYDMSNSCKEKE